MKIFFALLLFFSISSAQDDLTQYVNPFIGTAQHGHTYPGATVPFGMVQLSPDNGTEGWDWCSGYNYADSVIKGFSHTHLSGTGIGDLCDILFMPAILDDPNGTYSSRFSHAEERAEPGYYRVHLQTPNITAELTATMRAGFHRYTFPESRHSRIIIDLGHRLNWDSPVRSRITVVNKTTVAGFRFSEGWAKDQKIFFAAKFSEPIRQFRLGNDSTLFSNISAVEGEAVKGVLDFETYNNEKIMVKVGISAVSIEGAVKNLDSEIPDWDFDGVRKSAQQLWNGELKKIRVTGSDRSKKEIFYTALYHTMLAPVVYNDVDGNYRGGDGEIHSGAAFTNYTIFSLWDTFRAAHPLYTIIQPERVNDFINTMLAFKKESGFLPVWTLHANETNCMIGYHSVPVMVDAYMKGFRNYDTDEAFASMVKSAERNGNGLQWYREYGYVPAEKEPESVSKTLEYCFDDWCIARMAKAMNKQDEYAEFAKRAEYFKNIFDPATLFMRGKFSDGTWREPFDPLSVDHRANDYTEGNAWQYSWYVPHDVPALIALTGGNEKFIRRLDSLFEQHSALTGSNISPDISGMIGQYAQGNEPSHHIAYLYMFAGAPWKTQERVSTIMRTLYTDSPAGLCGNEDCGQMSAWYVFSAMGMYPVNPADQNYIFGTPLFEKMQIDVGNGKTFTIEAKNISERNIYVQSIMLNGKPVEGISIRHSDLIKGGELKFEMGDSPHIN